MNANVRILLAVIALFSISQVLWAESESDEFIDKGGRRGGVSRGHRLGAGVQQRQSQRALVNPTAGARRQSAVQNITGARLGRQSNRGTGTVRATIDRNSGRVSTNVSGKQRQTANQTSARTQDSTAGTSQRQRTTSRSTNNNSQYSLFNPPKIGDTHVWQNTQGGQTNRSNTTTNSTKPGRLADPGDSRLVYRNPFPGPSVEPQVQDNRRAFTPVSSAPRSRKSRQNTIGRNFIDSAHIPHPSTTPLVNFSGGLWNERDKRGRIW